MKTNAMIVYDEYREVKNHENTYLAIALQLNGGNSVVVGWGDEASSTHFDILFTYSPVQYGTLQRGLKGRKELFVSIMSKGAFAFRVPREMDIYPSYVEEKLGEMGTTADAVTELINGVIKYIYK